MEYKALLLFILTELALYVQSEVPSKQPEVSVYPASASLTLGEDFVAVCHLPGIDVLDMVNIYPVKWYKDNTQISYLHSITNSASEKRFSCEILRAETGQIESRIRIKGVSVSDSGRYTCRAGDKNDSVLLSVVANGGQPEVTVVPRGMNLSTGDNFRATCHFPGINTLDMMSFYPVQWFRGGSRISFLSSIDEMIEDNRYIVSVDVHDANNLSAVLTIKNVSAIDEGVYTCKVGNKSSATRLFIIEDSPLLHTDKCKDICPTSSKETIIYWADQKLDCNKK